MAAFAVEAHKRGKTTFEIEYNQPERIRELFELIAQDRGLGKILGKGIIAASRLLDLEDIAIHVKGLEPAGYDPRSLKGMGLSYATSARGACHLRGTFYKAEISGQIPKDQIEGKAELQIDYEDRSAIFDCLILCRFFRDLTLWDELAMYIKSITGLDFSRTHLQCLANDVTQRTRAYNTREGVGPDTDTLPKRFLKESTREGESISLEQLQTMINEYNQIRRDREKQWDSLRIVPPKSDKERISA
jgi:aldehyde:ferredoxin oxidoreductase